MGVKHDLKGKYITWRYQANKKANEFCQFQFVKTRTDRIKLFKSRLFGI